MNSFETDVKRALSGINFIIPLIVEYLILWRTGYESEIFQISVPVLASIPYSTAWLNEYQSGFIKEYLPRCGKISYILGKFLACGISGGALLVLSGFLCQWTGAVEETPVDFSLLFLSGMFWAAVSATLAAAAGSRYVAYGGSFVLFYVLVILYQRYLKDLYCLYPPEWYAPKHSWVLDNTGIIIMMTGFIAVTGVIYYSILRRCIERV